MNIFFNKYLLGIILIIFCCILNACSLNGTQVISRVLQSDQLIEIINTKPPNLSLRSQCSSPPTVHIVNVETNSQDHIYYEWWPNSVYIKPNELMNSVANYMSNSFNLAGIKPDLHSKNVIQVSMEKLTTWYTFFNYSSNTQFKIIIPEINYTQIYGHSETTPRGPHIAVIFDIHEISLKIINDPIVQDYLLCNKKTVIDRSPIGETALDILKKRYAKGEITKEQYDTMKKNIQ